MPEITNDQLQALINAQQAVMNVLASLAMPEKKPAKRGRPRLEKSDQVEEIITELPPLPEESFEEVLTFKPPAPPKNSYTIAARRVSAEGGLTKGSLDQFTPVSTGVKRKIKFVDDKSVPPDSEEFKKKYAQLEPHEPRPAKVKMKFTCSQCGRNFEAYPSEHPEAFVKFAAADIGLREDGFINRAKCNECTTR